MNRILDRLKGGDLRSLGNTDAVAREIRSQSEFDLLFEGLTHDDEVIVMRSADAIEKVTRLKAQFLKPHKKTLLGLFPVAHQKELKWHLALLAPRLSLTRTETGAVWSALSRWALDPNEGRIVRVNSIQGLSEMLRESPGLTRDFELTLRELERKNIPSISARIRKLRRTAKARIARRPR